jgi:ADP-ribose pyrophosphatase YjhB (NUDIX family)
MTLELLVNRESRGLTPRMHCPYCKGLGDIDYDPKRNQHRLAPHYGPRGNATDPCIDTTRFVAFLPEPFSVVCLVWSGAELLVVSRRDNHADLGLPGGKADGDGLVPDEDPFAAIVRETRQETGIEIIEADYVFRRDDYRKPGDVRPTMPALCFAVNAYKGEPRSMEGSWVGWVKPSALVSPQCSFREYNMSLFDALGIDYRVV